MRTSSSVDREQQHITRALRALDEAVSELANARSSLHYAGRLGWESDVDKLARRVALLTQRIEAAR